MKYTEIKIESRKEDGEIITALLGELPFEGFWVQDDCITAYLPEELFSPSFCASLDKLASGKPEFTWTSSALPDVNWNKEWESNFPWVLIGDRCLIKAPFHTNVPEAEFVIHMTPRMAFGTGHHATTSMVGEFLLEMKPENLKVLDMGCGTALLAILAEKLNASEVLAIDNDENACENAKLNLESNACKTSVKVMHGDGTTIAGMHFDMILANIERNVLVADMHRYAASLSSGGHLIISGILEADEEIMKSSALAQGMIFDRLRRKNGWLAMCFRKQ